MKVRLDDYGSETSFAIEDASGREIKAWGPFADNQNGKVITEEIELPRGVYTFIIHDDFGDGICCGGGRGRWELFRDGRRLKVSNGRFGNFEEFDFSVGGARLSGPDHRVDPQDEAVLAKKDQY